jgi:hypothetical protein
MAKKKSAPKKKRAGVKVKKVPRKRKKADDIFSPHGYKRSRKK